MHLIFAIIAPWILFYISAIFAVLMLVSESPKLPLTLHQATLILLAAGTIFCLIANSASIRKAGIWLQEALPEQLRYGTGRWIFLAIKTAAVAGVIIGIGQLPWTPLVWQGIILPIGVSICLFVFLWLIYGSILRWSVNFPWSRVFALVLTFPLMALVPLTAYHMQKKILFAYRASQADPAIALDETSSSGSSSSVALPATPAPASAADPKAKHDAAAKVPQDPALPPEKTKILIVSSKAEDRAMAFRALSNSKSLCAEHGKDVTKALDPRGDPQVVLAAVKAAKCADLKAVIALPRFVQIMNEHKNPETRAAAIRALRYYGWEQARQLSYLLVKRLGENEPPEVIDATSEVLAALGSDQARWATNRLKALLDVDKTSEYAAAALMKHLKRADLVGEYVKAHLPEDGAPRTRAISMICSLPPETRTMAESHISKIVASVKTADQEDRSLAALRCLGSAGVKAIRDELRSPKNLDHAVAAHAFAEVEADKTPESIDTVSTCVKDSNSEVRKWCSQTLGRLGAPALPKIMELINSSDHALKSSGQNALMHFSDPNAEKELQKVLEANTGWMATPHKLQVAKLVGSTLNRLKKSTD